MESDLIRWRQCTFQGHNDLGYIHSLTPAECATLCLEHTDCMSFDFGARDTVKGDCILSTANRASAGCVLPTSRGRLLVCPYALAPVRARVPVFCCPPQRFCVRARAW